MWIDPFKGTCSAGIDRRTGSRMDWTHGLKCSMHVLSLRHTQVSFILLDSIHKAVLFWLHRIWLYMMSPSTGHCIDSCLSRYVWISRKWALSFGPCVKIQVTSMPREDIYNMWNSVLLAPVKMRMIWVTREYNKYSTCLVHVWS